MRIVNEKLLKEFRQKERCEYCNRPCESLDAHHLVQRGLGGGKRLDISPNLAALCRFCHTDYHAGKIMYEDMLAVVAAREGVLQDDIRKVMQWIRKLPQRPLPYQLEEALKELSSTQKKIVEKVLA